MATTGSKSCPTCLKQWAGTFKFCPEDGAVLMSIQAQDTVLSAPAVRMTELAATRTLGAAPSVASPPSPSAPSLDMAPGVAQERTPTKPRKGSPRILNLEPVPPESVIEPESPRREAAPADPPAAEPPPPVERSGARKLAATPPSRELGLRTAPTVLTASAASSLLAESRMRAATPVSPEAALPEARPPEPVAVPEKIASRAAAGTRRAPAEGSPKVPPKAARPTGSRRKPAAFSETDWFMRPTQAVDPETGRVAVDPSAYVRDESVPEEKRRRFSLRRKDEE